MSDLGGIPDVSLPGRQPFSERELTLSPRKRDLEGAFGQAGGSAAVRNLMR